MTQNAYARVDRRAHARACFEPVCGGAPSSHVEALDYFLETGKQKDTLHGILTDAFHRKTVWHGRAGRES